MNSPRWVQCNHRDLNVGEKVEESEKAEMTEAGSERCNIADFEAGGRGHKAKNVGTSGSWKRPRNILLWGLQKEHNPVTMTLAQ